MIDGDEGRKGGSASCWGRRSTALPSHHATDTAHHISHINAATQSNTQPTAPAMDELDQLPTVLSFPSNLPYPITISKFLVKPGDQIKRGQNVLSYSYVVDGSLLREAGDGNGPAAKKRKQDVETLIAMWESSIEGEVVQWDESIREKMTIYGPG